MQPKIILSYLLILISAGVSGYWFYLIGGKNHFLGYAFFICLPFTVTLMLIFLLFLKPKWEKLLSFFVYSCMNWYVLFFLSYFTGTLAVFVTVLTAGIAALIEVALLNQFIKKTNAEPIVALIIGAFSSVINTTVGLLYNGETNTAISKIFTNYVLLIFVWQLLVGFYIVHAITKKAEQ